MLLRNIEMSNEVFNQLTPEELMEKFNLAFYEGQNLPRTEVPTFAEPEIKDDYFVDYLISNGENGGPEFDFTDFVKTFDENLCPSTDAETSASSENFLSGTTFSQFFVPPSLQSLDNLDLSDIEICETLSTESLNLDDLASDLQDLDETTFNRKENVSNNEFLAFLRNLPEDSLSYMNLEAPSGDFGHLIGDRYQNTSADLAETGTYREVGDNQVVLNQSEALLSLEDPLLSSSNVILARQRHESEGSLYEEEEVSSSMLMQCEWLNCYQIYDCQTSLVKHIEKCHVEVKRGDEFTCFWANCPRKVKPFNARYKLLIHMRVHSGEKPNKCPFEGCTKAFSRLENLKIHQRSHTGERPYLCQFPTCAKSFSNSSDRAKHQRTHFDTKPYACQVVGCTKKYTDPSSLRKHVKNHTNEEQKLLKKKSNEDFFNAAYVRKFFDPNRQKALKAEKEDHYANLEHNYSNSYCSSKKFCSNNIKQDLKNKISEKNRQRKFEY